MSKNANWLINKFQTKHINNWKLTLLFVPAGYFLLFRFDREKTQAS